MRRDSEAVAPVVLGGGQRQDHAVCSIDGLVNACCGGIEDNGVHVLERKVQRSSGRELSWSSGGFGGGLGSASRCQKDCRDSDHYSSQGGSLCGNLLIIRGSYAEWMMMATLDDN